ncbi:ATP-dependent DNA helicase [Rathayibacter sp. YIM 133350]|uniref:ATP-dependent helicase n=1 Tax=Rathayibacter sp. YIM 133350 TaxID=3131992 RepID=UPI00307E3C6E
MLRSPSVASTPSPEAIPLDSSQRAVLAIADGVSAAIIGAPGSGKTTAVVEMVRERIIGRGYAPGEVLVLAATRESATRLRDRLALRVGVPTNGPLARTANSLAFQVVRAASAHPPVLLTGAEQDQIIADLLQGHLDDGTGPEWPDPLSPDVRRLRAFRTEMRDLMARMVEYGVSPSRLARWGREHDTPAWVAAAEFVQEYGDVKDAFRAQAYDSAELVLEAAALVREAQLGDAGASTLGALAALRLLVIDDAQEATRSTLTLAREFARRGVAVIAAGDPDISTGSFRGAHPDALGRLGAFLDVPVETLTLTEVHRHGDAIRTAVGAITGRIGAAAAGRQRAATSAGSGGVVRTLVLDGPAHQTEAIARALRERHLFDGIPWNDMAVLVRSGGLIEPLSRGLAALEVPTRVTTAASALRDEPVVQAFALALDVAMGRRRLDAALAVQLVTGPLGGLDPIALRRLRGALRREELAAGGTRGGDELLVEALTMIAGFAAIDNATARRASRIADSMRTASAEAAAGASIEELLWGIWERSGLTRTWPAQARENGIAADEANRHLDAVVALFAAAQRFVERTPEAPPGLFLDELMARDVAEDTLAPRAVAESVTVSTPAGLIGREFALVVVAGVQENVWPDMRVRGSLLSAGDVAALATGSAEAAADARTAVLHDELRMFAQALSRSRDEVIVTAVRDEDQAPSAFLAVLPEPDQDGADRHPLSLRGLAARLRRVLTTESDPLRRRQAAAALARLAEEGVPGADPAQWYGLAAPSTTRPLHDEGEQPVHVSPSRIEAFETCELHWLIDSLGGSTKNTASSLGSIIHAVAEEAGDDIGSQALLDAVQERWGELPFEADWQSGVEHAKAEDLTRRLSAYLHDFRASGGELLRTEEAFELPVGNAVLRGSIDRVELRDGQVFIVDLKTGKNDPATDAAVSDHAQLGAYQLAFADRAIEGMPDAALGGARLVIVSAGSARTPWKQPTQQPFDDEQLAAFRARVEEDARRMGGTTFIAQIGAHCFDPFGFGNCRIHVIGQVSA